MKKRCLHLVVEFKNGDVNDLVLSPADCFSRLKFIIDSCFLDVDLDTCSLGLHSLRSVRVEGAAHHVLYEFRDIKSIVNQSNLVNYE